MPESALSPLFPLMVAAGAANAMVAVVLWQLARREPGYLGLWAAAFAVTGIRHFTVVGLWPFDASLALSATTIAVAWVVVAGLLLLAGTYRLRGRRMPRAFVLGGTCAVAWAAAGELMELPFMIGMVPPFFFIAAVDVVAGIGVLRSGPPSIGRRLAGWTFILWGVHRADYPFVRPLESLAPWGFALAVLLSFAVAVGLLLVHYEMARERLEASEARFRSFFENALDGMFQASPEGRLLRANLALVNMLGYDDEAELLEASADNAIFAERGARDETIEKKHNLEFVRGLETTWLSKDGRPVRVRINARRERSPDGRTLFFEGSAIDVTVGRALEARVREAEKLEAVGRLAGGVAHDFNNLLTAIIASADLALEGLPPSSPGSEEIRLVREAADQAASLTAQLLAFSRRQPVHVQPHDLNELLRSSHALLRRLIDESVPVELELEESPLLVEVDPAQIQQILLNLAINARDAMPESGRIALRAGRVERQGQPRARLEVSDTGHGMDEETRRRAFEPFFSTKEVGRGTGLGLASVYGIVARLGGAIDLESEPGAGTTVRIDLPLLPPRENPPAGATERPSEPAPGGGRTVLLVEDQEAVRAVLERALTRLGFSVLCAADGAAALALLDEHEAAVDLVVTDVVMPRMTGTELLQRLRQRWPQLPAVLVTGYSPESLDGVLADPRNRLLTKPFTPAALLDEARALLERPAA